MATFLRELYDVLSCFSTATHIRMCNDFLNKLNKSKRRDHLAAYFARALEANKGDINQIEVPFLPVTRSGKSGTNPVASVMAKSSPLRVAIPSIGPYAFTFLQREIPHLRAATKREQKNKAWIDYAAVSECRPILGEIKWQDDKNAFYAFVQLLTYLSEMATPNQIERSIRYHLFGKDVSVIVGFDLHILLVNCKDHGGKKPLVDLTYQLASAFKKKLREDYPAVAACLGDVLCIAARIETGKSCFSDIKCLWRA